MARFNGASVNEKGWPTPTGLGQPKPKVKALTGDPWVDYGLQPKLNLAQAAADFYLLADLAVEDDDADDLMRAHAEILAQQFARYIEIACAGEARYGVGGGIHNMGSVARNPQFKAFCAAIKALQQHGGRANVWANYDSLTRRFGKQTLVFLVLLFDRGHWASKAFGGKKWGVCAKTALAYRRGQMSAVLFVDTAFGLTHNGNIVYDKLWSVGGLKKVLDYNLVGEIAAVAKYARPSIRNRWAKVRM